MVVGGECTFYVHERCFRGRSELLDAAIKKASIDNARHQRIVTLPNDDPEAFNGYLHWLYSGKFVPQLPEVEYRYVYLFKLHSFAEKYKDRAFQDEVVDQIVYESRSSRLYPHRNFVNTVYQETPPESPARRLLVNMTIVYGWVGWFTGPPTDHPIAYLQDVIKAFMQSARDNSLDIVKAELEAGVPSSYHHLAADKSDGKTEQKSGRKTSQATGPQQTAVKNSKTGNSSPTYST